MRPAVLILFIAFVASSARGAHQSFSAKGADQSADLAADQFKLFQRICVETAPSFDAGVVRAAEIAIKARIKSDDATFLIDGLILYIEPFEDDLGAGRKCSVGVYKPNVMHDLRFEEIVRRSKISWPEYRFIQQEEKEEGRNFFGLVSTVTENYKKYCSIIVIYWTRESSALISVISVAATDDDPQCEDVR